MEKVSPGQGGCWFCSTKTDDMEFDTEFDTYFHMDCLKEDLEKVAETGNLSESPIMGEYFAQYDPELKKLVDAARTKIDEWYNADYEFEEDETENNHGKVGKALYLKFSITEATKMELGSHFDLKDGLILTPRDLEKAGAISTADIHIDESTQGKYECVCEFGTEVYE